MAGGHSRVHSEIRALRTELHELIGRGNLGYLHLPILDSGGKMLRPRWTVLCAAVGEEIDGSPEWKTVRQAALAVELIHVGSLYHDDIVDRSPTRRGSPAAYKRHGNLVAALAGAHLLALGNQLAAGLPDRLRKCWGTAALRMANGQLSDTEHAGSFERSTEAYIHNAKRKTGSVFELAATFGTTLGKPPPVSLDTNPIKV